MRPQPVDEADVKSRVAWFHQARFGMFVHWGLYSVLGRGEWVMFNERIPLRQYAGLARRFCPKKEFAREWAKRAAESGMKYMVLTTRHHDSFCLFSTATTDFSAPRLIGRDLVAEYVEAAREAGLKVGFYYSLFNWSFPGGQEPSRYTGSMEAMSDQIHRQVQELMTQYGAIDLLWYDGTGWFDWEKRGIKNPALIWRADELNAMVRRLQPQILINDRAGVAADFVTHEGSVGGPKEGLPAESCMTIGDWQGWGYMRNNPNIKPVSQILQSLVLAANWEGNLLLNVGPRADGSIPGREVAVLKRIGQWMKTNGEAVYGCQTCGLSTWPDGDWHIGLWTRKGTTAYLHVFRWPGVQLVLPLIGSLPRSVSILGSGSSVPFLYCPENGRLTLGPLPRRAPDPVATVVKFEFECEPNQLKIQDRAAWITADPQGELIPT